jgi:5'-methylthioadenosine phosphorylase
MVTDYDCWWEAETGHTVSVELVIENLNKNIETTKTILRNALRRLPETQTCACRTALANAIMTDKALWPQNTVKKLEPLLQKYL